MIRIALRRTAGTATITSIALIASVGAARTLGAQAISTPAPDETPDAVGCWTMRTDTMGRDAGESLGLPAQLRLDLRGEGIAVREGIQRRASWRADDDGTLRVTLTAMSGTTWMLELRRAEGEWTGAANMLAGSYASRRTAPRVTLVPGSTCPKR